MRNTITCLPPWLSNNKQCNETYPTDTFDDSFYDEIYKNYLQTLLMGSNIKFEEECRQSCEETTYTVIEKGVILRDWAARYASITFDPKVLVTERVPNYSMFQYIIDVGSSLGLWLGLSVLGLHDLAVSAVQVIKDKFVIRKIKSALPM